MELPAALAPWAAYLALFPDEVASTIGPLVHRLARFFGADEPQSEQDGDPEGYDGMDRRGSYERLLLSEWLLADELPDEFLRRAASNEHNFLQLARAVHAEKRQVVVLFDAGPEQLGGPRLVHLAVLILLARRAQTNGSQLLWGVLQHPPELVTGLNESSVVRLLRRRILKTPDARDLEHWAQSLLQHNDGSDVWLVGRQCKKLPGLSRNSFVEVEELHANGERTLQVAVLRPGVRSRQIVLAFPNDVDGARVVRNPFRLQPVGASNYDGPGFNSNIVFSSTGKHFIVRSAPNTVAIFRTPSAPVGQLSPKIYRMSSRDRVFAAGAGIRKAAAVLVTTVGEDELLVEFVGGSNHQRCIEVSLDLERRGAPSIHIAGKLYPCYSTSTDKNEDELFINFEEVSCFVPLHLGNSVEATVCDVGPVLAVSSFHGNLSLFDVRGQVLSMANGGFRCAFGARVAPIDQAFWGYGGRANIANLGVIAIGTNNSWVVHDRQGEIDFGDLQDDRVLGVVGVWGKERAGLIVVKSERPCEPFIMGNNYTMRLPETSAPIKHLAVNIYGLVVYSSVSNEVVVFDPGRGLLYRMLPQTLSDA